MRKGIIAGISAGVFWGLPFLAPQVLSSFSALWIVIGRFMFFGAFSLIFLSDAIKLFKSFSIKDKIIITALSAFGFCAYSLVLFQGVRLTNGVISALIEGILPLTITLFSKPDFNKLFTKGIILILIGLIFLLIYPFIKELDEIKEINPQGIFLLLVALFLWTWFAITNTKFLHRHKSISTKSYTSLMGIINLFLILPLFAFTNGVSTLFANPKIYNFLMWSAILGIAVSWLANWLWTICSKHCPPSISGTLIISEIIFALLYSFMFEQRLPHLNETLAILFLAGGVVTVIKSQHKILGHG
jgi:drug/metabolite transporter (DMT)-like permease